MHLHMLTHALRLCTIRNVDTLLRENNMVRVSVGVEDKDWRLLRDIAEVERDATGRASVAHIIRQLIAKRLREN